MSKAIKIYAISPEKDYAGIEFFFKHLENFLNHKEQILQCEDLYRIPIAGMGICGLFLGECPVCLGDLMLLYQDAWKFNQGEDTRYLIHMAGSPLSGAGIESSSARAFNAYPVARTRARMSE